MAKNKSYNKLIAGTMTAAMVAGVVAPVAASAEEKKFSDVPAGHWSEKAINAMAAKGIIAGQGDGTFGFNQNVTRAQVATFMVKAKEVKIDENAKPSFTDVADNNIYKKFIAAAETNKIMSGLGDGKFGPDENLTRAQMAQILVNAYGFKADENNKKTFKDIDGLGWATAKSSIETLASLGIVSGRDADTFDPNGVVTRQEAAQFIYNAMNYKPEVKDAKVESVNVINAKTIEVKFTTPVDAKTLKKDNKDVITVVADKDAADAGQVTQELSKDGKTLTLKAAKIFKGEYTVKVPFEIVKDTKGNYVSPVNAKVKAEDKTAPALVSAAATVKDTKEKVQEITLNFDEEVQSIDTVKIDGVNYTAAVSGNKATVAVNLDATKNYDVTVVNATDAAGNIKDVQVAPLNVTVDSAAPSIVNVEAVGENKVKVTVDKELAGDNLNISGKVGTFNSEIVTSAVVNPENKKEYTVTLNNSYLFKNGNSDTVTLTVKKDALVDKLGNKNSADITKTVVVSKDAAAPGVVKVATSTTQGKVTSFSVTYNEEVTSVDTSKVSVVNSKGEILSAATVVKDTKVADNDKKTVVFTLVDGLKTDKYSFDLGEGFVTDTALAPNKSAKHAFTVDVTEDGKPAETTFTIKEATASNNVITVDFGAKVKATGTGSALNPSAYQVNGVALPSDTVIKFVTVNGVVDQNKVEITLPNGFVKANDEKAVFRVNAVQTLDNKVSNSFSALIKVADNTAPEVKSITATDLTKLTVTYSEAIKLDTTADITDEIALVDDKGVAVPFTVTEVTADGKLVLAVTDATKVKSLSTLKVADAKNANIVDLNDVAQKAGVTVSK